MEDVQIDLTCSWSENADTEIWVSSRKRKASEEPEDAPSKTKTFYGWGDFVPASSLLPKKAKKEPHGLPTTGDVMNSLVELKSNGIILRGRDSWRIIEKVDKLGAQIQLAEIKLEENQKLEKEYKKFIDYYEEELEEVETKKYQLKLKSLEAKTNYLHAKVTGLNDRIHTLSTHSLYSFIIKCKCCNCS